MTEKEFTARLQTILEHNSINRLYEREKSGTINAKRLGFYGTTERLFSKRSQEKLERKYSIAILLDGSGSMYHDYLDKDTRLEVANKVARTFCSCLDQVKGISYEITIFGHTDFVFKQYEQPMDYADFQNLYTFRGLDIRVGWKIIDGVLEDCIGDITGCFDVHGFTENNFDSVALSRAYDRLLKQEGHKILFVVSDGKPNGILLDLSYRPVSIRGDMKDIAPLINYQGQALKVVTNRIKREGLVDLLSIGIGTDYVKDYYQHWKKIDTEQEFLQQTIRLFNKVIRKV